MPFDPQLADPISRLRFAVGDKAQRELAPDATYLAAIEQTLARPIIFLASASTGQLVATAHGYRNRQAAMLMEPSPAGLAVGAVYYVRSATADQLQLATSRAGAPIPLLDGPAELGLVDEIAATRAIAAALAAELAQRPDRISDSGSSLSWAARVEQLNKIAAGEIPAGVAALLGGASRASGVTLRRGPRRDFTTGAGDE